MKISSFKSIFSVLLIIINIAVYVVSFLADIGFLTIMECHLQPNASHSSFLKADYKEDR